MRSAQTIEAQSCENSSDQQSKQEKKRKRGKDHHLSALGAPFRWKTGQSGNPGGKPKRDLASELAQAIFEENPEAIYQAQLALIQKSPYAFQVLAERGFGKLKESLEVSAAPELVERLRAGRKRVAESKKC